jgi:hypothetical protein
VPFLGLLPASFRVAALCLHSKLPSWYHCSVSFAWSVSHMFRLSEAGCWVSEQNYFLPDGVLSPMPNPHPGGPGSLLVWTLPFDGLVSYLVINWFQVLIQSQSLLLVRSTTTFDAIGSSPVA